MVIELRGVEFRNKGAELMLYAILDKVRREIPGVIFVMEKRGSASIKEQRNVGIYTKLTFVKYGINTKKIGKFIPKYIRRRLGYALEREIDVVFDGSGFAFGDFWGAKKAGERLADHIENWKKRGVKVIMLPQAFGPFHEPALQTKMKILLNNADLIFARDKYSYDYLKGIEGNHENIDLKPDFTNLIKGSSPDYFDPIADQIAIIPNNKLVEASVFNDREEYIRLLIKLVEVVKKGGSNPFFLIHEGAKDLQLAKDAIKAYGTSIKIIKEESPLYVKGIIGKSSGVITSRFHGLVSALSQAVPCLCIGWSHKYQALMEDYRFSEGLITTEHLKSAPLLEEKIALLTNENSSENIRGRLTKSAIEQKELSNQMWKKVFDVICT